MGFSSSSVLATKITLPETELPELNLPLKINVPISRQQVPIANSTSAEKLTRSLVVCAHAAGCGEASRLPSGPVSSNRKEPAPWGCESNIRFFSLLPAKVNRTRQSPIRFADCAVVVL